MCVHKLNRSRLNTHIYRLFLCALYIHMCALYIYDDDAVFPPLSAGRHTLYSSNSHEKSIDNASASVSCPHRFTHHFISFYYFFFLNRKTFIPFFFSLFLFWQSECVTLLTFFFYNLPLSLGVCVYSTQWNNFDEKKFKLPVIVFVCVHIYYELLCDRQCSINQVCVLSNRLYQ